MARPRMVLSEQQAREIFKLKNTHGFSSLHAASVSLAAIHKVSPKAIRDIWKGRSWLDVTFDFWDPCDRPPRKVLGRPKGRKDTKPRNLKSFQNDQVQPSNSTSGSSCLEAAEYRNAGNFYSSGSEADRCNAYNSPGSSNENVDREQFVFFADPVPALDTSVGQAELRLSLLGSHLLQNLMTMSRIPLSPPSELMQSMITLPSSTLLNQNALIPFRTQQLAFYAQMHERMSAYGGPPNPHLIPPFHRAFNPLGMGAFSPHDPRAPLLPARPTPIRPGCSPVQ